jgi:3-oxoacyl-[acyl-carrier protein] reductase
MFDLTGKTALVTGATGAIGGAIAEALHRQGATLAISGRRRDALDALATSLTERVHVLPCDLTDTAQADALVLQCEQTMGKIDILIANAGIHRFHPFAHMRDSDWNDVIAIDLTAVFRLARAAVPGMMRRRSGRVIGITSLFGVTGFPGHANYAAAKAGMIGLIKSIAQEYANRGVTANCIAPGFVETPMAGMTYHDEQRRAIVDRTPAGRLATAAEIGAAAAFIASDEAAYITGQTLHINGGMVMI